MKLPFSIPVLTVALALAAAPAAADQTVPGRAVMARSTGDALIIWDATPVVTSIVTDKLTDARANDLLERDALGVLAATAPDLDPSAKTVTIRVVYNKAGTVDPNYGLRTFAGVEHYAVVTASAADAHGDRDKWKELDAKAPVPAWITYSVTGHLPAR